MIRRFISITCTRVMSYYAVKVGRKPGIYNSWEECQAQVKGFQQAKYKKFNSVQEAETFIGQPSESRSNVSQILGVKKNVNFKAKDSKKSTVLAKLDQVPNTTEQRFIHREDLPIAPVVYTDGCCRGNGKERAVGGVGVYWAPHHPKNVSEYLDDDHPTNQKAELVAACRALETAIEMKLPAVELRTDSIYIIKAMTEWIENWRANSWKNSQGTDVSNREQMVRLSWLCTQVSVTWVHVPGHMGVYGNEQSDRLANQGAEKGPMI